MVPPFIVKCLMLNVFHVLPRKPLDPWNKVVLVKEKCMHILSVTKHAAAAVYNKTVVMDVY